MTISSAPRVLRPTLGSETVSFFFRPVVYGKFSTHLFISSDDQRWIQMDSTATHSPAGLATFTLRKGLWKHWSTSWTKMENGQLTFI
jgi:hypothetical protein